MNIEISKSVLEHILTNLQPFLEKKDTSQITSHIFIEAKESQLLFRSTDYEIGLEIKSEQCSIKEEGSTTANGKKLFDIIKILKDDNVTLFIENDTLHIKQSHSNFKLPVFNSDDFPSFPELNEKPKVDINSAILINSLKKITPAIDNNNPKFELNGALIDIKQETINFVSTDTRRLAVIEIANNHIDEALSIILPKKAIIEIQKLFYDDIELYYDNTYFIIKSNNTFFFTKLINGKFPDYTRIIPKDAKHTLQIEKERMIDAIKQITTISNDIKLTFESDHILFESLSDDNIEAKTKVDMTLNINESFVLAVNSRYLLDFLGQTTNSLFTMQTNDSNMPFVLQDDNFKTIVMPIVI